MNVAPYRIPAPAMAPEPTLDDAPINVDLFLCGMLVWSMSIVRLGIAIRMHQAFGVQSEPALAVLIVFALPWLARRGLRDRLKASRRG